MLVKKRVRILMYNKYTEDYKIYAQVINTSFKFKPVNHY